MVCCSLVPAIQLEARVRIQAMEKIAPESERAGRDGLLRQLDKKDSSLHLAQFIPRL